ncbi:hypothetical protein SAMN05421743_11083 [Thalassobacillus cyri]|uniref:Uncharacterized protein n=1 Tax=Thalassobacillus cyri TaxID=571932 RepID=A0A1H4F1E2_9BACI|nr:hypothetical protein [Thalassobacillus cyri]SEA91185.1 hypothetical protein SAMN05421743_11083 [Thalassobacillus cyri]
MILCEWKDFNSDLEAYTLDAFEESIGDEFHAMYVKEGEEIPSYIWTTNYVVMVKQNARIYQDLSFVKIPRNPVCE